MNLKSEAAFGKINSLFTKTGPQRMAESRFCLYPAASDIVSAKMPQPRVGPLTKAWVTAPTSLPF